jgi:hypothetical protein
MARKQWRCFHCDEVFTSQRCAGLHFGKDGDMTACKLKSYEGHLVSYIRELEDRIERYQNDDGHVMRSMLALEADHRQAIIRAEEEGYNRGVRDMTPICTAA